MLLTDTQIERYGRQIILPEIGGRGQKALLDSNVSIVGVGALAEALVPYLAGSGIGHLHLLPAPGEESRAAAMLGDRVISINPDVRVSVGTAVTVKAPDDLWCEVSGQQASALALVASARRANVSTILAGIAGATGWISFAGNRDPGAGCAFCGRLAVVPDPPAAEPSLLGQAILGSLASLLAAQIIQSRISPKRNPPGEWLRYDAETMTLTKQAITLRRNCPVCANRTGENGCHPTQDS